MGWRLLRHFANNFQGPHSPYACFDIFSIFLSRSMLGFEMPISSVVSNETILDGIGRVVITVRA